MQVRRLDQRLHHLFREERRTLRLPENELLQGLEAGVIAEQIGEELLGLFFAQGRKAKLGVVGLLSPLVAILRAVIHEQEQAGGGQALAQ